MHVVAGVIASVFDGGVANLNLEIIFTWLYSITLVRFTLLRIITRSKEKHTGDPF